MKAKAFAFVFLFLTITSFAQEEDVFVFSYFTNNGEDGLHLAYSHDGYEWKALGDSAWLTPSVGNAKLMRDPCIIFAQGKYHMVWTVSWNDRGIGYASSRDLIHWSDQQFLPVMEHEPKARNAWAPEIYFDQRKKDYVIYWASTVAGLFPETQHKKENAYNHRIYFTTTRDFKTLSPTALMYEPGFNVIDASVIDSDQGLLMFLKDETVEPAQKNIRLAKSKDGFLNFEKPGAPITGNYWAEGPTIIKIGNEWVVYFDKYINKSMGAVRSNDLLVWTDISEKISFPKGVRHGSVFTISSSHFNKLINHIR